MNRESDPVQHSRSTNIRPLEWKSKYEELEKSFAFLENKYSSLQQQLSERENEQNVTSPWTAVQPNQSKSANSSNPLGSQGRGDLLEAYKRTVAQLQEQKRVAEERAAHLSQQLIQERGERGETRGERLERSSNFERLERSSHVSHGERVERQQSHLSGGCGGLPKRPLQRGRDNGLSSTLSPSGRDLSPLNSPREKENGENDSQSANAVQLRERLSALEQTARE
jgi:hypothetical protein